MKIKFLKRNSLARQILAGYVIIIFVAVSCSLFCLSSLKINQNIDTQISEVNLPLTRSLKDFKTISNEMSVLTYNWIYKPNASDKERLLNIIEREVPQLVSGLNEIMKLSKEKSNDSVSIAFTMLKQITNHELEITKQLNDDSLYSNDVIVDKSIKIFESDVQPSQASLDKLLTKLIELQDKKNDIGSGRKEVFIFSFNLVICFYDISFCGYSLLFLSHNEGQCSTTN